MRCQRQYGGDYKMQGYNNYGNFGNTNGLRNNGAIGNMNGINNTGWNTIGYSGGGYQLNGYNTMPQQTDNRVYVNGRAGAEAHPLPQGMNMQILWDTDAKRFYIKGYDNNGVPRILEDNDYNPHVEPDVPKQKVDMSRYATKDDIKSMIGDAFKRYRTQGLEGYVTVDELDKRLSKLCVGSGGKVVTESDSNE